MEFPVSDEIEQHVKRLIIGDEVHLSNDMSDGERRAVSVRGLLNGGTLRLFTAKDLCVEPE